MAIGDLIDADNQIEFAGYLFGAGQDADFVAIDGLDDLPEVEDGNQRRARAHGSVLGPLFATTRVVTLSATMKAATAAKVAAVKAATTIVSAEQPVVIAVDGSVYRINGRVVRRRIPRSEEFQRGIARMTVQWEATDPRIYSNTLQSGTTGVGSVSGGLSLPHGFAHGFGTATAGTIATTNDGNTAAPWTATLTGPLTSPSISLVGGDGVLTLNGFVLADGDTLEFDSLARSVLLNGSASRLGSLTERAWFDLPIGSESVQLTAGSGTGSLTLRWRDTWL